MLLSVLLTSLLAIAQSAFFSQHFHLSAFPIQSQNFNHPACSQICKISAPSNFPQINISRKRHYRSTPYDISFYDSENDGEYSDEEGNLVNPFTSDYSELAMPIDTKLILGINKYSHDTSLCAADAMTGKILFALSKERLSRRKYDGGNVATLVETCLDQLQLTLDNVEKVVVNNHHHRVLPLEANYDHLEWEEGLGINGGAEGGYTDDENLFSQVPTKLEISHHLAHAYSAAAQCPFNVGLVVVMDGMGETYRTMRSAIEMNDKSYISDLLFEGQFECIPSDILDKARKSIFDWREGESVYVFTKDKSGLKVKPIFKRFVEERSPPTLYNHGFENMDSVGALYSRASSHIFGDWNACGKVMGLAPWMGYVWSTNIDKESEDGCLTANTIDRPIMKGHLYKEGKDGFHSNRSPMTGIPCIARNDPDLFDKNGNMVRQKRYDFDYNEDDDSVSLSSQSNTNHLPTQVALDAISLASRIQNDLESVAMDFVNHFKEKTKANNLCLAGGVALNSVLNGRLSRELGFKNVFIPSFPGDDGIAIGCCAYGLYGNAALASNDVTLLPPLWPAPLSPYLGPLYSEYDIRQAIEAAAPWLEVELIPDEQERIDLMVNELESGGIVAWFQGRSEMGPRALGHRSILADPREKKLLRFINESVKLRETFRPFAPSVLAEEADEWFDLGNALDDSSNVSPYMSVTAMVKKSKRELIPAVTHVDGSSRLQTVTNDSEPLYHKLISTFFKKTGVPMVLNTSFNTLKSEPIVETPKDAIRSFLSSMGSIEFLVMEKYVIKRKDADVRRLIGEGKQEKYTLPPSFPRRAGAVQFETKFSIATSNKDGEIVTSTKVKMPDRPMHYERDGGWFPLLDDLEGEILAICDGTIGVNEILAHFTPEDGDELVDTEFQENLFGNIVRRLVRLYEHTLISW